MVEGVEDFAEDGYEAIAPTGLMAARHLGVKEVNNGGVGVSGDENWFAHSTS